MNGAGERDVRSARPLSFPGEKDRHDDRGIAGAGEPERDLAGRAHCGVRAPNGTIPAGGVPAGGDFRTDGGEGSSVNAFTATVERDPDTGIYVGYVPGFPGAHSQGDTLDELEANLQEVISMLAEPRAEPFGVRLTPPLEW